jgi:protein involved in temperature-dependent protein secretion
MNAAFAAAEAHPRRDAKLLTIHSDWAWNVLHDRQLGATFAEAAVEAKPSDPDTRITLARINLVLGKTDEAREQLLALERLNRSGRLDSALAEIRRLLGSSAAPAQR